MIRRINILASLRRRRATLGRLVCLLFAFATITAGAAPCFAMAASPESVADPGVSHHEMAGHHDHSHALAGAHDHTMSSGETDHGSKPCPHCPLSSSMAGEGSLGSHALCSAGDDVADSGKTPVSVPVFKHLLSAPIVHLPAFHSHPSHAWTKQLAVAATGQVVALNLRHCVFLI